ncbi:helix-turn-helix domain-containing protein [Streptomyces lacrimifluminis]|uniref:helix-turn-helix domain-containing protein n=1 Tax=Streptomyces lacrimifluminis TaxID=1500077 RepID=UPI0027E5A645|nr:helix-turn-helix transcriptional regulator [Streptomyces lacrimifluminis]
MTSPSSSVQEARRALGKRLSEIRLEAGLTKRALANSLGWHESKCSRFESGTRPPSERDLRAWVLLAVHRARSRISSRRPGASRACTSSGAGWSAPA